jgi:hypothetical protein
MILTYFKTILVTSGIIAVSFATTPIVSAAGVDVFKAGCDAANQGAGASDQGGGSGGAGSTSICGATSSGDFNKLIHNVINILFIVLGMIAVIMIVIGGIRYTTSNGDSSQVKSAKDTIMYAVIGLVVAILAYAIVNFILSAFK